MDDLPVSATLTIPAAELSERFSRSSGPGGQGVNTSDSRAELTWDVARSNVLSDRQRERILTRLDGRLADGVLTVSAGDQRQQLANRRAARAKLAGMVAAAIADPPKPRRATVPGRTANERRLSDKRRRGDVKRGRSGDWR